jgi:hypothetical protein
MGDQLCIRKDTMHEREASRVLDLTARVVAETGPRLAGSAACKRGAEMMADEARGCCDRVETESFPLHPGAFLGFIHVLVSLYALSVPLLAFLPWASAGLMSLGVAILVLEFFLYREPIDPFFPKVEGLNVVGILEPSGPVKRQVIVSGHHDSAFIFNFFVDRPELYSRRLFGGMGTFALLWLASFPVAAFASPIVRIAAAILFAAAFALVLPLWRFASKEGTPGAGDNLSSSATALELARAFRSRRDAGKGLASTRIIFASFDAEEAGLRGARAYAKAHRAELSATPTFAFNMDCVYEADKLILLLSDINGSVKLDAEASELVAELGAKAGIKVKPQPIAFLTGGTDAAELAKAGVRATSLMGMDWSNSSRSAVYHTPRDRVDAIQPAAVQAALGLGMGFIEELDRGALDRP